jgi:hypothetical protein
MVLLTAPCWAFCTAARWCCSRRCGGHSAPPLDGVARGAVLGILHRPLDGVARAAVAGSQGMAIDSGLASCKAALETLTARCLEPTTAGSFSMLAPNNIDVGGRGRSPSRLRSPHVACRRSMDALTPPTSPASVLPATANSRMMAPTGHIEMSQEAQTSAPP